MFMDGLCQIATVGDPVGSGLGLCTGVHSLLLYRHQALKVKQMVVSETIVLFSRLPSLNRTKHPLLKAFFVWRGAALFGEGIPLYYTCMCLNEK